MLSGQKESLPSDEHKSLRPIRKLEELAFLLKVMEFRLLLLGLGKVEREKYSVLWFAREEKFSSMSRHQLVQESKNYIRDLRGMNVFNFSSEDEEYITRIYISSLRKDLLYLTRNRWPGPLLKEKEDKLLSELTHWVNETEDSVLIPLLISSIDNISVNIPGAAINFASYYFAKANYLFLSLDNQKPCRENMIKSPNFLKSATIWGYDLVPQCTLDEKKKTTYDKFHWLGGEVIGFGGLIITGISSVLNLTSSLLNYGGIFQLGIVSGITLMGIGCAIMLGRNFHVLAKFKRGSMSSLHFSDTVKPMLNTLFKKVLKDLLNKQREPDYPYLPADLPSLLPLISRYILSEADEPLEGKKKEKGEKKKTKGLQVKNSKESDDLKFATNNQEIKDICDSKNKTEYIALTDNKYIRLNEAKLVTLFKSHYPKEQPSLFLEDVRRTLDRDRSLDKLKENEKTGRKAQFTKCNKKLRLNNSLFRLGIYSHPPSEREIELGIRDEVYSPRKLVVRHKHS